MNSGASSSCQPTALLLALCCAASLTTCTARTFLQTVTGEVGAENYTYYRLNRPGNLILQLESIQGDADLYVSDHNIKPTYEDYEAQSVTCGLDIVEIPSSYERPVGVAVFGYISYEVSRYNLEIYLVSEEVETYDHLNEANSDDSYRSESSYEYEKRVPHPLPKDAEDEESPWWTLLVGILKIIVEILV